MKLPSFHNLSTVVKFETIRSLKKKSFWLMALGFPVLIAAVGGIVYFSNKTTAEEAVKLSKQKFSIEVVDDSGLVSPELLKSAGATVAKSRQSGVDDVKNDKVDAFFYYPKDITHQAIEVHAKDVGLLENNRYTSVAQNLLIQSVESTVSPAVVTVVGKKYQTHMSVYQNGEIHEAFKQMILPGIFLVLFYLLIAFFGNQMLTSTTEEKENRVIEMILTTIEARVLITGKIIALMLLALLQASIIVVPTLIGYSLFHSDLGMPSLSPSSLEVEPLRILIGFLIFITSFGLFTGLLVLIGAAMPTAKEAGQFFGIVILLIFGPLYAAPLFISSTTSSIVQALSLFPLTSPIPLLLRNSLGTLSYGEAALAISITIVTMIITFSIATRVFQYGALEYSRRVSIREIFTRK